MDKELVNTVPLQYIQIFQTISAFFYRATQVHLESNNSLCEKSKGVFFCGLFPTSFLVLVQQLQKWKVGEGSRKKEGKVRGWRRERKKETFLLFILGLCEIRVKELKEKKYYLFSVLAFNITIRVKLIVVVIVPVGTQKQVRLLQFLDRDIRGLRKWIEVGNERSEQKKRKYGP